MSLPPPGTPLCRLEEIEDGQAKGFSFGSGAALMEIFVVRKDRRVYGYVNLCPHAGSPLDWRPDRFMNATGRRIQCHTHGAQFEIETGLCVAGPCEGKSLHPIAVDLDGEDRVVLAETRAERG